MLGHDPAAPLKQPIDVAQLKDFIKMVHPDAMTLIVVGNVDSRSVAEQINKTFGDLKGKRKPRSGADLIAAAYRAGQHHDQRGASGQTVHHVGCAMAADPRLRGAAALLA